MLRLNINEQQRLRIANSPWRWGAGRDAYAALRDVVVTRRTKGKRVLNYYISLRGESLTIRRGAGLMTIMTCNLQGANNMTKCRFIHSFMHWLLAREHCSQRQQQEMNCIGAMTGMKTDIHLSQSLLLVLFKFVLVTEKKEKVKFFLVVVFLHTYPIAAASASGCWSVVARSVNEPYFCTTRRAALRRNPSTT